MNDSTSPRPATESEQELLGMLEAAFAQHADASGQIRAAELQRALGLRSSYLAGRVLRALDLDGDGSISRQEFIEAVRRVVLGDVRERLWFAFRIHDHDGDGFLDPSELLRMVSLGLAESEIAERVTQPAEYLTHVIFKEVDSNRDQRISFDELVAAVYRRPELLRQMTRSEATWMVPNEELLLWLASGAESGGTLGRAQGWARLVWLAVWLAANVALFVTMTVRGIALGSQDPLMAVGRALGVCLAFNGAWLLIPMLRRLLGKLRATRLGRVLPLDEAVGFHRLLGHTMFALALAHATCFVGAYAAGHAASPLSRLLLRTLVGTSGAALLVVFAVMWVFSLAIVRRTRHFELFYFTHLLYVVWLVLAVVHAPSFLLWAGVPLFAFVLEQGLRLARRGRVAQVTGLTPLRSAVTRVELAAPPDFAFSAGDYLFLRVPAVARHEWHPFTISSAPERARLTLHVRALGNWSSALRRLAESAPAAAQQAYLDGPYGAPSAHIFQSRIAVMIGAGIGVTPFASVLESLVLRANGESSAPCSLEKAYFFWLNRDQYSFEWFAELLARLDELDRRGLLEIHLCMTGARAGATALGLELARDILHNSGRSDMITGLRTHTHVGQPDWESFLRVIVARHAGVQVDAFYCGPPALARKLEPLCTRLGLSFREEKF